MELFNRKLKKLFLFQEGAEKSPKTNKKCLFWRFVICTAVKHRKIPCDYLYSAVKHKEIPCDYLYSSKA